MSRTKTLILLAIIIGLLLAACDPQASIKQADPGTGELKIIAWGMPNGGTTQITVVAANDENLTVWAGNASWYYDVPSDQVEYLIVFDNGNFYLHLHEAKNPQAR